MGDDDRERLERLAALAERLEFYFDRQPPGFELAYITPEDAAAAQDIARGLLARLPPADDDTPVDETWLRDRGAEQIDSIAQHWVIARADNRFEVYYFPKDATLRLLANNLNADGVTTSLGGCHVVTAKPTRGAVRRLLAALGIG